MLKSFLLALLTTLSLTAATFNVATTPELRTALETAATNGEDDTIVLADGTYKTTDDDGGTFIYFSNEANKLTLVGSSSENVILSGDNVAQILNHQSTEDAPMTLEKLSFVDGNNTIGNGGGGGVYTDYSIEVTDCNFTNNRANNGGGFYSSSSTTVTNSIFTDNSAYFSGGGGFYSSSSTTVINSIFTNNSAQTSGGGFYSSSSTTVINSIFTDNSATGYGGGFSSSSKYYTATTVSNSRFTNNSSNFGGGGFYSSSSSSTYSSSSTTVTNSIFTDNSTGNHGGGFYSSSTLVSNSVIINNSAAYNGGGFYGRDTKATNLLLTNNSSGIYMTTGENNIIANSIFKDNNTSDINGNSSVIISNLENNYLDTSKVTVSNFKKNNIFYGVNLGFVDEANGDYNLTAVSDLIDAGTTAITGLTLPTTDLNGNVRVIGGNIDIGPYEFSTTKPALSNFTYAGIAKELSELTFSVDYVLADGRTLDSMKYDYLNNGTWTTDNTYTFDTAGTYTINAKVTDSENEFSTVSLSLTVAPLPFADMTDEQKLVIAIDPAYYDEIVAIIESSKDTSNTSGYELGKYDGKTYVQDNLAEFNLVSKPTIEVTPTTLATLDIGWTLASTPFEITDMSVFDTVNLVWIFNNTTNSWSAYSSDADIIAAIYSTDSIGAITTIPAGSGIWVLK